MTRLATLTLAAALAACSPDAPTAAPPQPQAPALAVLTAQTPVILSAAVVGSQKGWNLVSVTWQDAAVGETWTIAGYSDSAGQWMFVTQAASADAYGAGTGTRTVEFLAPKKARYVQLMAKWANQDNTVAGDLTPYSTRFEITK